jgi:protein-disulfide isomerase
MKRLGFVPAAVVLATIACSAPSSPAPTTPDSNVRGQPTAPVLIEEWGDYQCPACGSFARLQPQLEQALLDDGSARFVFHNMAFLGQESVWAAAAAECANDQGRFWEYHDLLYASQNGENKGAFAKPRLKQLGASLRLDQAAFNMCVDSDAYVSRVQQDTQRGKSLGISSTPTLLVNGQRVTLTTNRSPIETLLAAVRNAPRR